MTSAPITVAQIADATDPIPSLMQGTVFATDAWADFVNSTGGADGHRIVIDHRPLAISAASAALCTQRELNGIVRLLNTRPRPDYTIKDVRPRLALTG